MIAYRLTPQPLITMTFHNMQYSFSLCSLALGATLVLMTACGSGNKDGGSAAAGAAVDTVQVFLLKTETFSKTVELPGELLPYLQTDLYAKVQGYVQAMKVDIGDRVRKGQTLAVIEAPEVNTQFTQSMAAQQAAKAKLPTSP